MKGNIYPMGQAEVVGRELVDKEMSHLIATNQISYVRGRWDFARGPAKVIELKPKG